MIALYITPIKQRNFVNKTERYSCNNMIYWYWVYGWGGGYRTICRNDNVKCKEKHRGAINIPFLQSLGPHPE